MENYEIIVLDLDGTLTNRDKVITPKTKKALMEIQERGKKIVLASGRPTDGVMPLARELKLEKYGSYILSFNGGMITNCRTGEVVFSRLLPVEANAKIIGLAEEERVTILTYDGHTLITNDAESPYSKLENKINSMEVRQIDDLKSYVTYPVPKFLMMDDGDYLAMVEPRVKAAMGKNFSIYRSEPFFLEITPLMVDKGTALMWLADSLGIRREQVMACGDGYNDITMISEAGIGVAMENAQEPAKNAADFVTLSNDDNGVAAAIKKFAL